MMSLSPVLHPAISNTNLASTRLKPKPVTGKKGDIFYHPAVVVPQDNILGRHMSKDKWEMGVGANGSQGEAACRLER